MNSILVTGGTGFIGSHTCLSLLSKGYKVIVVDFLANSSLKSLENIRKIFSYQKSEINKKLEFFKVDLRIKII